MFTLSKRSIRALLFFGIFYVGFGIYATLNQESIVYQPFPQDFESCESFSDAEKVTYNGTRMYVKEGNRGTVVFYHGNAGSACDRLWFSLVFGSEQFGYIFPEYAGYSNDTVKPSHKRIKQDVQNVVEYLKENEKEALVIGESIGTGAATYHASLYPPKGVMLLSPFTDLHDVARTRFWYYPTSLLIDNAYDNVQNLKGYDGRVTIIHGTEDNLIPPRLGQELFASLETADKAFIPITGFGHNDLTLSEATPIAIYNFLNDRDPFEDIVQ